MKKAIAIAAVVPASWIVYVQAQSIALNVATRATYLLFGLKTGERFEKWVAANYHIDPR